MPKYTYYCEKCNVSYTISHKINEIHDVCKSCGSEKNINKIPTSFNYSKKIEKNNQVGVLVNEAIEESKEIVEEAKLEFKKRTYED